MSNIKDLEITTQKGKDLLKKIKEALPGMVMRLVDTRGNQQYKLEEPLDAKVKELLEDLDLGVSFESIQNPVTTEYSQDLEHTVWHISNHIRIKASTGLGHLIPIRRSPTAARLVQSL